MIQGHASPEGTERYRRRFPELDQKSHFRRLGELWLSSIGLGTYLGHADDTTDLSYEEAVRVALEGGCNVFDTAINYRHQRSERALGRALERAIADGAVARDEIFVASKGGYLPFDAGIPADPETYLRQTFIDRGPLQEEDLVEGIHSMAPRFVENQLGCSRENLGLATLDLYYLHNPETQLRSVDEEVVYRRIGEAFGVLEARLEAGEIRAYGVATWNALRRPPGGRDHMSLERLAQLTTETGGDGGHLRAVQLPLNLAMPEALVRPTQQSGEVVLPLLVLARQLGLGVFTSASILQGRLASSLPPEIVEVFPALDSDSQRALQFARSAPGVTTALVGMSQRRHVEENLALARIEPASVEAFQKLFG